MTVLAEVVARLLLAPALVASVALLVKSYDGAGDGFSAGTLAALAVLMERAVSGRRHPKPRPPGGRRPPVAALAGAALMLAVVLAGPALGGFLVQHWPPHGGGSPPALGTLELHTAVLYDLGIAVLVFVTIVTVIDLVEHEASRGETR